MIRQQRNILFLAFAAVLVGTTISAKAEVIGKSIATVNGDAIYLSEYENNWKAFLDQQKRVAPADITADWTKTNRSELLDQMIDEKLLSQEAKKENIKVPKRQLEEGILQVKNRFKILPQGAKPSKEDYERALTSEEQTEFQKELKRQNLTEKEFTDKIEDQLKVMRLTEEEVRGKVAIPFKEEKTDPKEADNENSRQMTPEYEKQTQALFDELSKKYNQKDFKPNPDNEMDQLTSVLKTRLGEAVHARHILVKSSRSDDMKKRSEALNKIKKIKKELDSGADFVDVARSESDDSSAQSGGDLGFFTRGQMVPDFEKVAFSLPVGSVSDIVETQFGYHIIKVEEKRAAQRLRYSDVKNDLAGFLYQQKVRERYQKYVNELRQRADVKILMDINKLDRG